MSQPIRAQSNNLTTPPGRSTATRFCARWVRVALLALSTACLASCGAAKRCINGDQPSCGVIIEQCADASSDPWDCQMWADDLERADRPDRAAAILKGQCFGSPRQQPACKAYSDLGARMLEAGDVRGLAILRESCEPPNKTAWAEACAELAAYYTGAGDIDAALDFHQRACRGGAQTLVPTDRDALLHSYWSTVRPGECMAAAEILESRHQKDEGERWRERAAEMEEKDEKGTKRTDSSNQYAAQLEAEIAESHAQVMEHTFAALNQAGAHLQQQQRQQTEMNEAAAALTSVHKPAGAAPRAASAPSSTGQALQPVPTSGTTGKTAPTGASSAATASPKSGGGDRCETQMGPCLNECGGRDVSCNSECSRQYGALIGPSGQTNPKFAPCQAACNRSVIACNDACGAMCGFAPSGKPGRKTAK